jgi:Fe-S cluster assembly protein SufD
MTTRQQHNDPPSRWQPPVPTTRDEKEAWHFTHPRRLLTETSRTSTLSYAGEITSHVLAEETWHRGAHTASIAAGPEQLWVELVQGNTENSLLTDEITLTLAPEAHLTHVQVYTSGPGAKLRRVISVHAGAGATYRQFTLTAGPELARHETNIHLEGMGAHASLVALNLLRNSEKTDFLQKVNFHAPGCTAEVRNRNIVAGRGHAVFQGKFHVDQPAQQTDAYMMCQNLLLNEEARASHKPELEIYADDVKCSHGATTGGLDEAQLFYLQARGLPEQTARKLLIEAQVMDVLAAVPLCFHQYVRPVAQAWLESQTHV